MFFTDLSQCFWPILPPESSSDTGHGDGRRISKPNPMAQTDSSPPWALGNSSSGLISRKKFIPKPKIWEEERSGGSSCCPTCGVLQQEPTPVLVVILSRLQQIQIWGESDSSYSIFDDVVYEKQQNLNYKENEEKQQPERNKRLGFITTQWKPTQFSVNAIEKHISVTPQKPIY